MEKAPRARRVDAGRDLGNEAWSAVVGGPSRVCFVFYASFEASARVWWSAGEVRLATGAHRCGGGRVAAIYFAIRVEFRSTTRRSGARSRRNFERLEKMSLGRRSATGIVNLTSGRLVRPFFRDLLPARL